MLINLGRRQNYWLSLWFSNEWNNDGEGTLNTRAGESTQNIQTQSTVRELVNTKANTRIMITEQIYTLKKVNNLFFLKEKTGTILRNLDGSKN